MMAKKNFSRTNNGNGTKGSGSSEPTLTSKKDGSLTVKDVLFKNEYLVNGFNAKQAYHTVNPHVSENTAGVEGARLLRSPRIRKEVDKILTAMFDKMDVSTETVIASYVNQAFYDERSYFDDNDQFVGMQNLNIIQQACIESVETTNIYKDIPKVDSEGGKYTSNELVGTRTRVKFYSRKSALDSLAKYKGLIKGDTNTFIFNNQQDNRKIQMSIDSTELQERLGADTIIKLNKQLEANQQE